MATANVLSPLQTSMEQKPELVAGVRERLGSISRSGHLQASYHRLTDALVYVYAMGVPGDVAEFGTWTGRSSVVIAESVKILNEMYSRSKLEARRKVFYFDSFKGLPEITAKEDLESIHVQRGIWQQGSMAFHDPQSLFSLVGSCIEEQSFEIVPGYFEDTVAKVANANSFAFVHCDVDLYSSTIDALNPLFQARAVSPGCIILFDDWNCSQANPRLGQRKAFRDLSEQYNIDYSDEGSYSYHGRAFIIHDYR